MLSKTKMCSVKLAQEAIYITHEFSNQSNKKPDLSYPGLPSSLSLFVVVVTNKTTAGMVDQTNVALLYIHVQWGIVREILLHLLQEFIG